MAAVAALIGFAGNWATFDDFLPNRAEQQDLADVSADLDSLEAVVEDEPGSIQIGSELGEVEDPDESVSLTGSLPGSQTVGSGFLILVLGAVAAAIWFELNPSREASLIVTAAGALALTITALKIIDLGQATDANELTNWAPWLALIGAGGLTWFGIALLREPVDWRYIRSR